MSKEQFETIWVIIWSCSKPEYTWPESYKTKEEALDEMKQAEMKVEGPFKYVLSEK